MDTGPDDRAALPQLIKEVERIGDTDEKLRKLIGPKFIDSFDSYSRLLLDAFVRKRFGWTLEEFEALHWISVQAHLDIEIADMAGPTTAVLGGKALEASAGVIIDESHGQHLAMLAAFLPKIGIESFLGENPGLGRTSLMDYKAGRIKGKVSPTKRESIRGRDSPLCRTTPLIDRT